MRQIVFIIVLCSLLMPLAAYQHNLIASDSVFHSVFSQTTKYCQKAENWLWNR